MKEIPKYLDSNTSSIVPTSCYSTSNYPFIPLQIYVVKFFSAINKVDNKFIEFSDEIATNRNDNALKPKAGFIKGTFIMKDEFDEPIEEFSDYM